MIRRLFKHFQSRELTGAFLEPAHSWKVRPPRKLNRLPAALQALLPPDSVLVWEGTSIDPDVERRLAEHFVPPALEIRPGTIWPQPKVLHVRATPQALQIFGELLESFAQPEICNNLYAYVDGTLLLQWHDAFSDPVYIAGTIPEPAIATSCSILEVGAAERPRSMQPANS